MQENKNLKIGIFYDGNFLLHTSNYYNYIHQERRRLSIGGLHSFIKQLASQLESISLTDCYVSEAHYFRGRLNASEASQRGNQLYNDRVFDDILMSEGVTTHYLPLRNMFGRKEERGVDVWLALEALDITITRSLDMVVLIASDTDYVPLLRKLLTRGIKVMLLSWEFEYTNEEGHKVVTKTSHDLQGLATYPIAMHEVIEKGLRDNDSMITRMFVSCDGARMDAEEPVKVNHKEISEILSLKSGYGFIKFPNNNLFFHYQNVIGDFTDLQVGDRVEFELDKNEDNQDVAKNVRKIGSAVDFD